MNKKEYLSPIAEIQKFEINYVIATSETDINYDDLGGDDDF